MNSLVLTVGLAAIAGGWAFHFRARSRAGQASGWPTTPGAMTKSEVVHKVETTGDNDTQDIYSVRVAYSYEADGQTMTGTNLRLGGALRFTSAAQAEAVIARYPAGGRVEVRYNPRKPTESVLETVGPSLAAPLIASGIGVIIALIGVSLA